MFFRCHLVFFEGFRPKMSLTLEEAEKWAEELTFAYMCSLQEHWQFL